MPGPMGKQSIPVLKDYKGETALSSALKSLLVQGNPVCYVLKNGAAPGVDAFSGTGTGYDGLFQGMQEAGFELQTLNFRDTPAVPDGRVAVADRAASGPVAEGGRILVAAL